ncbi:MAG: T9SS type A sorting domain-containing protein, partial [Chlorobi bacterium]|nr:T9SS type A sorting domain-containing protein [Chlorobiota bacterium]
KLIYTILFVIFAVGYAGLAEDINKSHLPKLLGSSNSGTEFFLTFVPPVRMGGSGSIDPIKMYVSSSYETEVTLEVSGKGYHKIKKTVPNGIIEFILPEAIALPYTKSQLTLPLPEQVFPGAAIHISSKDPIVVYGVIKYTGTSDGYLAIPVAGLGKEYIVASWPDPFGGTETFKFSSFTSIIAPYNKTKAIVKIGGETWTETAGGKLAGETVEFNMNSADVVCIGSASHHGDLTGSKVTGTKLIGVISGNYCAFIPTGVRSCDYLVEMELPTNTWGTEYHVTPIQGRSKNSFIRIFSKEENTQIYRNGYAMGFIPKSGGIHGEGWAEYRAAEGDPVPVIISGDKPINVTQYNTGSHDDGTQSDPFQMVLTPFEQYQDEMMFSTPGITGGTGFSNNFINIIYKATEYGTIPDDLLFADITDGKFEWKQLNSIDAYPGTEFSAKVNNQRYFSKTVRLPHYGVYKIKAAAPFTAYAYGSSGESAYGFPAGVALKDLTINDTLCPDPEWEPDCSGDVEGIVNDRPNNSEFRSNLASIYMNTEYSFNYRFAYNEFIAGTDKSADWYLEVIDNLQAARATLVFSDRSGNDTTIVLEYFPTLVSINEEQYDFGKIKFGENKVHKFWIKNDSEVGDLNLTQLRLKHQNRGFKIIDNPTPCILQPLDSVSFTVEFTVCEEGIYTDSIGFGDPCFFWYKSFVKIQVGEPRILVGMYDFGSVEVGSNKYGIVTVQNIGSATLEIYDYTGPQLKPVYEVMDWTAFEEFGKDPTFENPWIIKPGIEKLFEVRFSPDKEGVCLDSVVFMSNTARPLNTYIDSVGELTGSGQITGLVSDKLADYPNIKLMPSPVQDILIIQNKGAALTTNKITIIDLNGRTVIDKNINILQGRYEINTSSLLSGVYILRIHAGDRVISEKFSVGR